MRNNLLLLIFVVGGSFPAFARADSTASKVSYFNSFHAGGLFGKKGSGSGASFATTHGIRFKKFALGAGVGYDGYHTWRTLPVFASVSYDFLPLGGGMTFFAQLSAGYSKAWYLLENQDQFTYDDSPGRCIHPVLGYRIHSDKFNLYVTAGYKVQAINYEQTPDWWTGGPGSKMYVVRHMERVSVQFGFGFR